MTARTDLPTMWADDLEVGTVVELGSYTVVREEILAFARQWDPQLFHVDDGFAEQHEFGEVIASGLHTLGVYQRLAVLGAYRRWRIIAGRTIRDIQLTRAVRAGDTLTGALEIVGSEVVDEARASITTRGRLWVDEHLALELTVMAYVRRRPAPAEGGWEDGRAGGVTEPAAAPTRRRRAGSGTP